MEQTVPSDPNYKACPVYLSMNLIQKYLVKKEGILGVGDEWSAVALSRHQFFCKGSFICQLVCGHSMQKNNLEFA